MSIACHFQYFIPASPVIAFALIGVFLFASVDLGFGVFFEIERRYHGNALAM
jgi:hypothetical protein